ncbi:MAG: exonuclease SbcCD subunit D [Anaerolineales bacterium]|nr:exonuclease SbcCD subunit D [Anaerolineales bacterium]
MVKILHFADAHIDMANYGRQDPDTGLPLRVIDFLKSLDEIVDTATREQVDCVIFAGDAYKNRDPAPTFQREWGKRIMRLSKAHIPTILLVGNHDVSPSVARAHALEEFSTLDVPHVLVVDKPTFLGPAELTQLCAPGKQLDMQLLAVPWVSRSGLMAYLDLQTRDINQLHEEMEKRLSNILQKWLDDADPRLPTILTAHASVEGAVYGRERSVLLGKDFVLPKSMVADPRLDYVAMGHIHKAQDLNKDAHPPVIYSGSIERVDFGEVRDEKFFILADVDKGKTEVDWQKLSGIRPFHDCYLKLEKQEDITEQIISSLPEPAVMADAVVRLVLEYPRAWAPLIDDRTIQEYASDVFEFHFVKRPQMDERIRLPQDQSVGDLTPSELLEKFWQASHVPEEDVKALQELAAVILNGEEEEVEAEVMEEIKVSAEEEVAPAQLR